MRHTQDADVLTASEPTRARSSLRLALPTAAAVVAVDQLTKTWAVNALAPGPCSQPDACIDLIAGIRFNLVYNTGAAFTRGSGYGPLIGVLAFIMTGVLLYLSTKRTDRFGIVLFGALAGGAVGNLLDRIFRADDGFLSGAVIDFIDVGWWPVFNVADSAIVLGVLGIIIHAFVVGEPGDDDGDVPGDDERRDSDVPGDDERRDPDVAAGDDGGAVPEPCGDRAE